MGYVFDEKDARAGELESRDPGHSAAVEVEHRLMMDMLNPFRGETVLDIGCGIGTSLSPFLDRGVMCTGLDPSPSMLSRASKALGTRVDLHRGVAEDLPFDDNAFHHACLFKTLEFTDDPVKAIEEACRVARDKVFIGIINRYSLKSSRIRIRSLFTHTAYNHVRFQSKGKVKKQIRRIMGNVPVCCKTAIRIPGGHGLIARQVVESDIVRKFPIGGFTGIVVTLVPRFRAMPLELGREKEQPDTTVASLARAKWR